MTLSRVFDFPRMLGCATSLLPLPVLRERAGVRVISSTNGHRNSKSPSPQPSPGVPGEGARAVRIEAAKRSDWLCCGIAIRLRPYCR
jgi:hypothetical protein